MHNLKPFRFWCQKVLPLVYDDSLSYYELLCKVIDYLNKTIENVNELGENFDELQQMFNTLKQYVDNYFKNLDVQEEINKKLDEMVSDGTILKIFSTLVPYVMVDWFKDATDTEKILSAIEYCLSNNIHKLVFNERIYTITQLKDITIKVPSNLTLDGNNCTITISDNVETEYFNLFGNDVNTKVENIYFKNFNFNLNGNNNLITDVTKRNNPQASIKFLNPECSNINIENCNFTNCSGLHFVYINGEKGTVKNCNFSECGGSIIGNTANNDFTCCFMRVKNGCVENCNFSNTYTVYQTTIGGGNTAIELHCELGVINDCNFKKFKQSIITDNDTTYNTNNIITNCNFDTINAVDIWSEDANIAHKTIIDNCFATMTDDGRFIYMYNCKQKPADIVITNCYLTHTDKSQNLTSIRNVGEFLCYNNIFNNCNSCLYFTNNDVTANFKIHDNIFKNSKNGIEEKNAIQNFFSIQNNIFNSISSVDINMNRCLPTSIISQNAHSENCLKCISNSNSSACNINEIFTNDTTDVYATNTSKIINKYEYKTYGSNPSLRWIKTPYVETNNFTVTITKSEAFDITTQNITLTYPIPVTDQLILCSTGNQDIIASPIYDNNTTFKIRLKSEKAFTGTVRVKWALLG